MRLAAVVLVIYGVLVLANAELYSRWSGELHQPSRVAIRIFGVALISWGLWQRQVWARWFGLAFSGLFALLGGVALAAAMQTGLLESRPYPSIDLGFMVGTVVCLVVVAVALAVRPGSTPGEPRRTPR